MLVDPRSLQQLSTGELRFQLLWKSLVAAAVAGSALPLVRPWPPSIAATLMVTLFLLLAIVATRGAWRAATELRRRNP